MHFLKFQQQLNPTFVTPIRSLKGTDLHSNNTQHQANLDAVQQHPSQILAFERVGRMFILGGHRLRECGDAIINGKHLAFLSERTDEPPFGVLGTVYVTNNVICAKQEYFFFYYRIFPTLSCDLPPYGRSYRRGYNVPLQAHLLSLRISTQTSCKACK
jgi:hypothetical protein